MTAAAAPKPRQTHAQLRRLQRLAGAAIMRPLSRQWTMQRRWIDDRPMQEVAAEFIKPNDRLTSLERIEIYNKQYWFRLVDCMFDDFPGLRAVLGRLKFNALLRAYLVQYPSRSFTLRNLGSHLAQFMKANPKLVSPRPDLAIDMAKFEWAQMIAFDGPAHPPLTVDDLLGKPPSKLRLALQPYLTILKLNYPLDDFAIQLKQHTLRKDASNAIEEHRTDSRKSTKRRPRLPRRQPICLVVHRHNNSLYYKRIEPPAYRLLCALRDGHPLQKALQIALGKRGNPAQAGQWFEIWSSLGWFCKPAPN
ncbi:MAG: DNA-binding domain-containing protein [Tepidisphaeraceae bacterium]|jgi:hypothetical protein